MKGIHMKGVTLTQPWATLVALGAKTIETRSWRTTYRGPLAIHAGMNKTYMARLCGDPLFRDALGGMSPFELPRGVFVAVAQLVGLVETHVLDKADRSWAWTSPQGRFYEFNLTDQERAFGDYVPGRYAWLLSDVRPLATSIPCRGALGLWAVPGDVAAQIEAVL